MRIVHGQLNPSDIDGKSDWQGKYFISRIHIFFYLSRIPQLRKLFMQMLAWQSFLRTIFLPITSQKSGSNTLIVVKLVGFVSLGE